jgi:ABC-type methionine transport system permease subunit
VTAIALVGSTAVAGVIGAGGLGNLAYLTGLLSILFVAQSPIN